VFRLDELISLDLGKEVANKFQVEQNAKLFPAVICEPTVKEMFQFELGFTRVNY
jgi:hypothetical protein